MMGSSFLEGDVHDMHCKNQQYFCWKTCALKEKTINFETKWGFSFLMLSTHWRVGHSTSCQHLACRAGFPGLTSAGTESRVLSASAWDPQVTRGALGSWTAGLFSLVVWLLWSVTEWHTMELIKHVHLLMVLSIQVTGEGKTLPVCVQFKPAASGVTPGVWNFLSAREFSLFLP